MSGTPVVCERCLDVIVSRHRHDFVTCSCGDISVDGGSDYLKVMWNVAEGAGYHVATPEELMRRPVDNPPEKFSPGVT